MSESKSIFYHFKRADSGQEDAIRVLKGEQGYTILLLQKNTEGSVKYVNHRISKDNMISLIKEIEKTL